MKVNYLTTGHFIAYGMATLAAPKADRAFLRDWEKPSPKDVAITARQAQERLGMDGIRARDIALMKPDSMPENRRDHWPMPIPKDKPKPVERLSKARLEELEAYEAFLADRANRNRVVGKRSFLAMLQARNS